MKRARLNLVIDAVVGGAFLVTAVTGVVFLLPPAWQQALLVGLSFHAWHWLHDWSGAVAAAGVALHLVLHWRWVVHTASRWLAEARGELPDRRPQRTTERTPERAPERRAQPRGHLTRRGFLVGAAGFGAALVGGVALSRIAGAVDTDQTTAAGVSTGQGGAGSTAGSSSSGASAGAASSSGATGTTTPRVVVDSSSCIACGHCIQVCPRSVFAWNSAGRATAQSPESCILCRRCVQVCPASAITLNA